MANKFYYKFKGDNMLRYLSYLSTLQANSRFCYRIELAIIKAYLMWRRGKYDWCAITRILEYGYHQIEDPQELLFIETVNSPIGSYKVFPASFLTYKYTPSQLLYVAKNNGISIEKLGAVYSILELSNLIVEKYGYTRNVCGKYNAEKVCYSNYKTYSTAIRHNSFDKKTIECVFTKYGQNINSLQQMLLNMKRKEFDREFDKKGYSDFFELHPFLKLNNGDYLVLFPATLLRLAYKLCIEILIKELGKENFISIFENEIVNEVGYILEQNHGYFEGKKDCEGVSFLWFAIDFDKIANVAIIIADKKPNIEKAVKASETEMTKIYPNKQIFTLFVVQQLETDELFMGFSRPITHFSIEDFKIVMGQDRMNLLNLYYYDQDKKNVTFAPGSQEIDKFAYYHSNDNTFYQDEMPNIMRIEIGYALSIREKFLSRIDEHMVYYTPENCHVLVRHYADIPKQIPIYAPYISIKRLLMLQLNHHELWIHVICKDEFRILGRETAIALMNWIFAIDKELNISSINQNLHVEIFILPNIGYQWEKANEYTMNLCIPENIISSEATDLEQVLVGEFLRAIQDCGFTACEFLYDVGMQLFDSTSGRFIQIGKRETLTIIDEKDGVDSCYFVNSRYCNTILTEIADYLNMKGFERTFDFAESKEIMIKVSDYILTEVKTLLKEMDTKLLLESLLRLHHAMIYWSKLTQRRYESLSKAYSFLNATFENQFDYVNEYSEMNTLTQGMIETIILNSIHNRGGKPGLEKMDRLFALMHFCLNMGVFMDQLGEKIKGSELTILPNGRLVMPRPVIDKLNTYFFRLREISMSKPDLYARLFKLMPTSTIDTDNMIFIKAYKAQFGISFEQYCKVITVSIDYATANEKPIMVLPEKDFYSNVCSKILNDKEIKAFKEHFVLVEDLKNENLKYSDKWIQRFNRPVQITMRPWILFDGDIYYSTKTIYESWMIRVERLNNGTVTNTTAEMQALVSKINNDKGHEFTVNVKMFYDNLSLDYLYVRAEVEIMPGKPLNSEKPLGDIDVLLINRSTKQIVCIEAKNYSESRTAYELIQQNRKIEEKELSHVIERDNWCKKNVEKFKFYVPEVDGNYSVKTIFLTYHENAYNYFEHTQSTDITFISAFDIVENPMIVFFDNK